MLWRHRGADRPSRADARRPARNRRAGPVVEPLEGRQLLSGAAHVVAAPHYQSFTGQITGVAEHPLVSSPAPHLSPHGAHGGGGADPSALQYLANASTTALLPNGIHPGATARTLIRPPRRSSSSGAWGWFTGQFVDLSHYFNSLVRSPHRPSR